MAAQTSGIDRNEEIVIINLCIRTLMYEKIGGIFRMISSVLHFSQ